MTGLLLQGFKDDSSEKLVHVLLYEQKKMFGERNSGLKKAGDNRLFLSLLAGLILKIIKAGGRHVTK
jgi:hypothetical protein